MNKAVIFDLDGTLVDSFKAHYLAMKDAFKEVDVEITESEFKTLFGKFINVIISDHLKNIGKTLASTEISEIANRKQEIFREKYVDKVMLLDGGIDCLEKLEKTGYKISLASNSNKKNIDAMIDSVGIRKYFKHIISVDDIKHPKPHPQMFNEAAKNMDVQNENCIVIEDSIHGIQAAKAGRMNSIAVLTGGGTEEQFIEAGADIVLKDLNGFDIEFCNLLIQKNM